MKATKQLTQLKAGERGHLHSINDRKKLVRFAAMGIVPGCEIELLQRGFAGGSWYIRQGSSRLALRQKEAALLNLIQS